MHFIIKILTDKETSHISSVKILPSLEVINISFCSQSHWIHSFNVYLKYCKYVLHHVWEDRSSSLSLSGPGSLRQRDSFSWSWSSWLSGTFAFGLVSPSVRSVLFLRLGLWDGSSTRLMASGGRLGSGRETRLSPSSS